MRSTEQTDSREVAGTSEQSSRAVNDYRMEQPQLGDAGGQGAHVSHVLPVSFADTTRAGADLAPWPFRPVSRPPAAVLRASVASFSQS
jgi:hypothetical protein